MIQGVARSRWWPSPTCVGIDRFLPELASSVAIAHTFPPRLRPFSSAPPTKPRPRGVFLLSPTIFPIQFPDLTMEIRPSPP